MGSSAGDVESERVLREIEMGTGLVRPLVPPCQESQDWDEDATEALRLVGFLPPAVLPEAAQSEPIVDLPGPTQMWGQHSVPETAPAIATQRGRSATRNEGSWIP